MLILFYVYFRCFEVDKENIPVIKDEFDNTDTSCLDFDG
jgi:hypothetical protein